MTALASICLLDPESPVYTARFELYYFETITIVYVAIILTSFAAMRTKSRRIYSLIASNMALDNNIRTSKIHWRSLLKFFHPKPLHCFSILGSEISWFFCLKVSCEPNRAPSPGTRGLTSLLDPSHSADLLDGERSFGHFKLESAKGGIKGARSGVES